MNRDPLEDILPEHTRRPLEEQARQVAETHRHFVSSMQAAQDALRRLGAFDLDQRTTEALKSFASPISPPGMVALAGMQSDIFPEHTRLLLKDQAAQFAEMLQRDLNPDPRTRETFARIAGSSSSWPVMEAIAGIRAEMEIQGSMFRDIRATVARALEVPAFIRDLTLPTREEMEKGHQRFVHAAQSLAKAGWTFSTGMTVSDIVHLAEQHDGRNAAALDDWFIEYYAAERGREFRSLAARLLRRKRLETWRALLRDSLWAYASQQTTR